MICAWIAEQIASFKDYIKYEVVLVEENYEFIEEYEYFENLLIESD
jgi:ERCC4-type nuclease